MDNVLQIPRSKMYWLPYPISSSNVPNERCALCPHLFKASLECLSPKLVLVMGHSLSGRVSLRGKNGAPQLGQEVEFQTNKWTIPGVWTHHPTDMVTSTQLKKECMQHLEVFKRLMRRSRIWQNSGQKQTNSFFVNDFFELDVYFVPTLQRCHQMNLRV